MPIASTYDPFERGAAPVGVRTIEARDDTRDRTLTIETWYPADERYRGQDLDPATQDAISIPSRPAPRRQAAVRDAGVADGPHPVVLFSPGSGYWNRRMATYLCTHLASHGYVIAAMDHSELVAPELARKANENEDERRTRIDGWIANRVPDMRLLADVVLGDCDVRVDANSLGVVGHSFGGWTVLAAAEVDRRIKSVVALAPGGNSRPKPGIIPARLSFSWEPDVPVLYVAGDADILTPLDGITELYEHTPGAKSLVVLRGVDHVHFLDGAEEEHELMRSMTWAGELAWISNELRPFSELCPEADAHRTVRGLCCLHFDATLRRNRR